VHEEAEPQVVQAKGGDVRREPLRRAQPPHDRAGDLRSLAVVAGEAEPAARPLDPGRRLGGVVQEGGEAHRLAARQLVGELLAQQRADGLGVLAEAGGDGVALDRDHLVEHLERVVVDVEVVEHVLLDAAQREQLGQHLRGDAVRVHQLQPGADGRRADHVLELAEHALGGHLLEPRRGGADRVRGAGLDRQLEVDRDPDPAQRAQRVVGERLARDHAQPPGLEVGAAAVRVEQLAARERLGHRVDGEVARREVGADVAVAEHDQVDVPGVAGPDDAPRAERAREPERRAAGGARERARGILGVLGDRDVEVGRRAAEQAVAHGAADDPRVAAGEDLAGRFERRAGGHGAAPSRWYARGTRALIPHVIS
jgi:hypothetical protein